MSEISASVGRFDGGNRQCHNIPGDQIIVIDLLNRIARAEGGRRENPIPRNPRWGIATTDLHEAIRTFQRTQHLPVDGHVSPRRVTLRRLDELASAGSHPPVQTRELPWAIRTHPDYVERRVQGVGSVGLGQPFRLDLSLDANMTPGRSIHVDRSRFNWVSDPFANGVEYGLTGIFATEQDALSAVASAPGRRPGFIVYAHYVGPENIIFPTIMSATTTPALIRALQLVVDDEIQFANAASDLLINAFFTLGGVRYGPVTTTGSAAQSIRSTALRLLREQPRGRAVVNLAGTGEVQGAINVNTLTGQQVREIPNLIQAGAEMVGEIFPRGSIHQVVSNNVVFGQVEWNAAARGCYAILQRGGSVSIAPYAGQLAEHLEAIAAALRSAGFRDVTVRAGRYVTAIRP